MPDMNCFMDLIPLAHPHGGPVACTTRFVERPVNGNADFVMCGANMLVLGSNLHVVHMALPA